MSRSARAPVSLPISGSRGEAEAAFREMTDASRLAMPSAAPAAAPPAPPPAPVSVACACLAANARAAEAALSRALDEVRAAAAAAEAGQQNLAAGCLVVAEPDLDVALVLARAALALARVSR